MEPSGVFAPVSFRAVGKRGLRSRTVHCRKSVLIPMVRNSSNNCRHSAAGRALCTSVSWRNVPFSPWHAAPAAAPAGGFAIRDRAPRIRIALLQRISETTFRVFT